MFGYIPTLLFKETIPDYGCGVHQARREGGVPGPCDVTGTRPRHRSKMQKKGVARGFLLTSNVHKIHFRRGSAPKPAEGAYDAPRTP